MAARRALFALILAVAALPAGAEAIGDAARGEGLFKRQCWACHKVGPEAKNGVGPRLNRIFGRRAGSLTDFKYSKSMTRMGSDGLVWTLETLDAYIENPKALVSGTRMNYRGLADPEARAALLAFLRDWSDKPQNIPEAAPTALKTNPDLSPEVL